MSKEAIGYKRVISSDLHPIVYRSIVGLAILPIATVLVGLTFIGMVLVFVAHGAAPGAYS